MRFAPVLLLLLSACVSIPLPHGREPVSENQRPALARKMVAEKHEPNQLVATDGSRCSTTESHRSHKPSITCSFARTVLQLGHQLTAARLRSARPALNSLTKIHCVQR